MGRRFGEQTLDVAISWISAPPDAASRLPAGVQPVGRCDGKNANITPVFTNFAGGGYGLFHDAALIYNDQLSIWPWFL